MTRCGEDPAVARRKRESSLWVGVDAECTSDRYDAVAGQVIAERGGEGSGDRVAMDIVGQRQWSPMAITVRESIAATPVLIEHVTEAQVGDSSAADSAELAQWGAEARQAEQEIDPVAAALEWRAMVR